MTVSKHILSDLHGLRGDIFTKSAVVFNKQKGGPVFQKEFLDLHPRNHVDEIQRLVPDIQMSPLAETGSNQNFLFLPAAEVFHILIKLLSGKAHFSEAGFQQRFLDSPASGILSESSLQKIAALGNTGNDQPPVDPQFAAVRDILPADQF